MLERKKSTRRGFAGMDKARQREIAAKAGASVPDEKRSFSTHEGLASKAGQKGGRALHRRGSQKNK